LVLSPASPDRAATRQGSTWFRLNWSRSGLELLRELLPQTARVAVLVNPADTTTAESTLKDVEPAARAIGLQIRILNASTPAEIDMAFTTIAHERPDRGFCRVRSLFHQPARAVGQLGIAPCNAHDLRYPRNHRSRRTNKLWLECPRCVASTRDPYRPCSQWCEARGPAGRASLEVRTCHQRSDSENPRPNSATRAARSRRRGDPVNVRYSP
jgi:hypothetical protein